MGLRECLFARIPEVQLDSYQWNGIEIQFVDWQARVIEVDLCRDTVVEAYTRQLLGLRDEEKLHAGLYIFDGGKPRLVILRGLYQQNSSALLQAAFRLDLQDDEIVVRSSRGFKTNVFGDRPCGPGYNLNPHRYSQFRIIREGGNTLVLERSEKN